MRVGICLRLTLIITAMNRGVELGGRTLHPLCYRVDGGAVVAGVLVAGCIFALPVWNGEKIMSIGSEPSQMFTLDLQPHLVWTVKVQPVLSVPVHAVWTPRRHGMWIYRCSASVFGWAYWPTHLWRTWHQLQPEVWLEDRQRSQLRCWRQAEQTDREEGERQWHHQPHRSGKWCFPIKAYWAGRWTQQQSSWWSSWCPVQPCGTHK